MNNQPQPANLAAEEAILGSILFDPMAMSRVEPDLKIEAFYLQSHQDIYRAARNLTKLFPRPTSIAILNL